MLHTPSYLRNSRPASSVYLACPSIDIAEVDSDHDDISAVLPKDIVIRQKRQRFRQCLRQEHPIERIAMQRRQLIHLCRMFTAD